MSVLSSVSMFCKITGICGGLIDFWLIRCILKEKGLAVYRENL